MKTMKSTVFTAGSLLLTAFVLMTTFSSCDDYMSGKTFLTSDEIMIDEYIEQEDTTMMLFLNAADKAGFRGLLHAYGTNTCFIPDNNAIRIYCAEQGISSLETLSVEELEKFMKFHLVRDTIQSAEFVDGRLSKATMLGKFLTTRTVQEGTALPVIRVNRQANILAKDIRVANGIIHKIANVLTPNPKTVGEMINELPENYSLFKSLMQESGVLDTLITNKGDDQWYTAILQSNESFATAGINSREDLIEKMKVAQPDYVDDEAMLVKLYAQYHVLKRLAYATDLSLSSTELTMAPNQVITITVKKDSLILNEYRSLSRFEQGVSVNKLSEWTDLSCYNGVLIDMEGYIQPVKRGPEAVYWELTDQPEIKKLKEYRRPGSWVTFRPGELSELNFGGKNDPTITYNAVAAWGEKDQYVNGDQFDIPMRPTVVQWMEIKTPVLTEGVYYVWICWRRGGENNKFKTTFMQEGKEDQVLPNVFDLGEYFNTNATPEVNLNNGMKQYNAKQKISVFCSRNCGAIKVEYTGRHTLRMDALSGKNQSAWWDMIHFIPVDQNQLWPRFDGAGNAIYPGTACEDIYPADQTCSGDLNN
ncbi:MAG: fasciclin domain-containing protein [Paludibacter sp.]|nr:fasciclin domain-containing protein [Paludibacter sp.]